MTASAIVVDAAIVSALSHVAPPLRVVPRRRRRGRGESWMPLDPETVADVLAGVPGPAIVLARGGDADPGAACLVPLGHAFGHRVLRLPDHVDEAAWSAAVCGELARRDVDCLERVLEVLASGPTGPWVRGRREWGVAGIPVPAIRTGTLGRWAACVWRQCAWCRAGGAPGRNCPRCGASIADGRGQGGGRE